MATSNGPSRPLSSEVQAAALWEYIKGRHPHFTSQEALQVVQQLAPEPDEPTKHLAKRLGPALHRRGCRVKLAACIEAAARIQGHTSWHTAQETSPGGLVLVALTGPLTEWDKFQAAEERLANWHALAPRLAYWCGQRLRDHDAKVFEVRIEPEHLTVSAPVRRTVDERERYASETFIVVRPEAPNPRWLEGAPAAVEYLRRHSEECGVAVIDGAAVLELCRRQLTGPNVPAGAHELTQDVANSELILLREDGDTEPGGGFEIARGDEMTCWAQLDLAVKDSRGSGGVPGAEEVRAEGAAWVVRGGRYVWELTSIRPRESAVDVVTRRLSGAECQRLLRRYTLAKKIFSGQVRHHEVNKRVAFLSGPREVYKVDLHRMLRVGQAAGYTWDAVCEKVGVTPPTEPVLPLGTIISAAQLLSPKEPNVFFARPQKSEMVRVGDDQVLRALMPRVEGARYRLGPGAEESRDVVKEAMTELNDNLRVRTLTKAGLFTNANEELPQLVYAHDGEDFRLKLQEHGLVAYAAVLPNLTPVEQLTGKAPEEGMSPFAFGHVLYLHIEADGAGG